MSLIRKVLWPTAIALGFLVFLGAIGSGNVVKPAFANEGNLCKILGPKVITEDETYVYIGLIEDDDDDDSYMVSIDNASGNSKITSVLDEGNDEDLEIDEHQEISPVNSIADVSSADPTDLDSELIEWYIDQWKINPVTNDCGDSLASLLQQCTDANDDDDQPCSEDAANEMSAAEQAAFVTAVNALLLVGENDCETLAEAGREAALGQGAKNVEIDAASDFIFDEDNPADTTVPTGGLGDVCDDFLEDVVIVDVTCNSAGSFDLTFTSEDEDDDALTIEVVCRGAPDSSSTIAVTPSTVEIVPALGNVSHALVTVTLLADGEQAGAGSEVDFTVDRCTIEVSGVDTAAEYGAASTVFRNFNRNVASTAADVEASAAALSAIDSTRTADTVTSFYNTAGDVTLAAAILGCNPADTGATVATPGVATITAVIEVVDGQDVVKQITVTVIGPPHTLTVAIAPSTLRCGEKATVTATVKDSIGQNVSDHTRIEAVTNAGGVLGGTGAVAGLAGPVVPISSTVAETFAGVATFYLLTSEQHSGPYEVVVTTGGAGAVTSSLGGVFSTPPLSAQSTVTCTIPTVAAPAAPAPVATIAAPRTGQGTISPPNTGDAGLVSESSSSALFLLIGAVALTIGMVATLKFARR